MAAARLRRPPSHLERTAYDDQAIDGEAALAGYTTGAAAAVGDDAWLGRVRPGFGADLTVMAGDPVEADPGALATLPVLMTIVDGEIVHRA